ncbi:hypothetical protein ACWDUL_25700 [Nocardia niigatensis]|uniref:hypothetical protein n=1 Tax=Nocardia niigatensis TaxID=209249 RepID=UPI0002D5C241|nr:hypothetical protein [Nocardia niigatensis]
MGTTNSPASWTDERKNAEAGLLTYTPDVAISAINICNDLLGQMLDVQFSLNNNNITEMKDFAGPSDPFKSGHRITQVFNDCGTNFKDVLKKHIDTVTDMAETFKAAGKAFEGADQNSADALDKIAVTNQPAGSKIPPVDYGHVAGVPKDAAKTAADITVTSTDLKAVPCENSTSLSWESLHLLKVNIDANAPAIAGKHWDWMASELSAAFGDFRNQIVGLKGEWKGTGSDSAQQSVNKYATEADQQLTPGMKAISKALTNLSGWLAATREKMPDKEHEPAPPASDGQYMNPGTGDMYVDGDSDLSLAEYQDRFSKTYAVGIKEYNEALPASLPDPAVSFVPVQPTPPEQPQLSPGPGGTNPSPGGTTPASPTTPTTPTVPTDPNTPSNPNNPTTPNTNNPTNTNDQTLTTVVSAVENLAQQGVSLVESLAQSGETMVQQGITSLSSLLTGQQTQQTTTTEQQQMQQLLSSLTNPGSVPASPGGSPSVTPTGSNPTPAKDNPQSKLFPRAGIQSNTDDKEEAVTATRAGLATGGSTTTTSGTSGSSGMPMSAGGQAGSQGGSKEHKRPEFLRSGENLDSVFEQIPAAVRPVAEE